MVVHSAVVCPNRPVMGRHRCRHREIRRTLRLEHVAARDGRAYVVKVDLIQYPDDRSVTPDGIEIRHPYFLEVYDLSAWVLLKNASDAEVGEFVVKDDENVELDIVEQTGRFVDRGLAWQRIR